MVAAYILVYSLMVILGIIVVLNLLLGKASLMRMFSAKADREFFDKRGLPVYFKLVGLCFVASFIYAVLVTRNVTLILQFGLGSTVIVAIGLVNIVLYKRDG